MSRSRRSVGARVLLVAGVIGFAGVTPAIAQSAPGWTFAMKMSVDSGAGAPPVAMTMRQQRVPGKVRMAFSTPAFAGTKMDGMYTIMTDADSTISSVVPGMQMATIMNFGGMMDMDMDMSHMSHLKSGAEHVVTDSLDDLGETESILGHATHHYRETRVGTLDIAAGSQMCVQHFNTVTEEWLSLDPALADALAMDRTKLADSPFEAFAPDLSSSTSKLPKGVPLRTVEKATRGGAGGPRTVTTAIEVTELTHGDLSDSLFMVPAAYNSVDMRTMLAGMPPHMMDSAMDDAMQKQMQAMCDSGQR